jgi:hypothetical protein
VFKGLEAATNMVKTVDLLIVFYPQKGVFREQKDITGPQYNRNIGSDGLRRFRGRLR